ncbi:MAG: hypothetical protein ACLQQ4_18725 [Bacteroidia bacterium]
MTHNFLKISLGLLVIGGLCSCNKEQQETPPPPPTPPPYKVIDGPQDLVIDKAGNMYFTNQIDYNILKVNAGGAISSVAGIDTVPGCSGDGGPATAAHFTNLLGIAMDASGNIYFSDTYCQRIHKMTISSGTMTLVAGNGFTGFSGDGGPATSAEICAPYTITFDTSGNMYFADNGNNRIRMINMATGIINTIAGNGTKGFSGDGGPATAAELNVAIGVAVDDSGNVYIADDYNTRIRKVTASSGTINTIISGTDAICLVLDTAKNIYFAEGVVHGYDVCKYNYKTGMITTIAGNGIVGNSGDGGPATAGELNYPTGIALDNSGNLYIADFGNNNIRKVTISTGIITTVAHN